MHPPYRPIKELLCRSALLPEPVVRIIESLQSILIDIGRVRFEVPILPERCSSVEVAVKRFKSKPELCAASFFHRLFSEHLNRCEDWAEQELIHLGRPG
jgi:hypothetical protein